MCIYDHFTSFAKIHGDLSTHVGLHLSNTPIRLLRMPHQHARL